MLKSTHRPQHPPLPAPWSEHKAPTGHTYYYNRETKESTYQRPAIAIPLAPPPPVLNPSFAISQSNFSWNGQPNPAFAARFGSLPGNASINGNPGSYHQNHQNHQYHHRNHYNRRDAQDRPRSRHAVPGRRDWMLVKTKLGRRFVHNVETNESFWKVPQDLISALVEFDIAERDRRENGQQGAGRSEDAAAAIGRSKSPRTAAVEDDDDDRPHSGADVEQEGDDRADDLEDIDDAELYEAASSAYHAESPPSKRQRTAEPDDDGALPQNEEAEEDAEYMMEEVEEDGEGEDGYEDEEALTDTNPQAQDTAVEFGEEEMAAQLAAMGESYDLDPSEYYAADEAYEGMEGEQAPQELTEEEAMASFDDMLDDHGIDAFATWDTIIDQNNRSSEIISDDRYTLLPNMRSRKDAFAKWSSARVTAIRAEREKQAKQNPRIPFLALLANHATPKLYWAEFKRKWKREPEMRDSKLSDRDRERLYRDYISRITKMSETALREDLAALMQSLRPSRTWNRGSSIDGTMPEELLQDVRYISVKPRERERLVADVARTLPTAEEMAATGHMTAEQVKQRQEREKRDEAVRRRGEQVEAAKRGQQKELLQGQRRLRFEERELERASRVDKTGLMGNLE